MFLACVVRLELEPTKQNTSKNKALKGGFKIRVEKQYKICRFNHENKEK